MCIAAVRVCMCVRGTFGIVLSMCLCVYAHARVVYMFVYMCVVCVGSMCAHA